jgi:hypothetical protein
MAGLKFASCMTLSSSEFFRTKSGFLVTAVLKAELNRCEHVNLGAFFVNNGTARYRRIEKVDRYDTIHNLTDFDPNELILDL